MEKNPLSPSLQVPSNAQQIKKDFQPQAVPQCSDICSKNNALSKTKTAQQTNNQMNENCKNQPVHCPLPQFNKTSKLQFLWSINPTRKINVSPSSIDKTNFCKLCPPVHYHQSAEGLSTESSEDENIKITKDNTPQKMNLILDSFKDTERIIKFLECTEGFLDIMTLLKDFMRAITFKEHKENMNVKRGRNYK